ncbi:YybH family protein [Acinetobacter sp. CFCC 10889]|uniref:YybH family protein n=1 Tax=Acinetobacter sp. CFCC 10889 TaxID=1775557 RepID=UPI000DD0C972|nr:nuclear transport factor 2 family protein [Acinetobacter sp. CFCC 10889]
MNFEVDGDPIAAKNVLAQIQKWDHALKNNDLEQITQDYADDIRLFDVSSQLNGLEQYKTELEKISPYFTHNINIRRRDLKIHVSGDVAFLYCYTKMENPQLNEFFQMPWCRTTLCLQKKNDQWVLLHQHISMPVNMLTKKAIDLKVKAQLKLVV